MPPALRYVARIYRRGRSRSRGRTRRSSQEKPRMKKDIHPKYEDATITCICGNVIHTRSTVKDMKTNTCSACHPFYTGTSKLVDTAGRVEQFRKKYNIK